MKKLIAVAFATLLFVGNVSAGNVVRIISDSKLRPADEARAESIQNVIKFLEVRIAGAIQDGEFSAGYAFSERLDSEAEKVITDYFFKFGYGIKWEFDEKTHEARLIITWS